MLRELVDVVGAERVLLGSDYPFDMGVAAPTDVVRALHLPPDDEARIFGGQRGQVTGDSVLTLTTSKPRRGTRCARV